MSASPILAFDTATRATAVALSLSDGTVLECRDDPPRGSRPRHAARLLPLCAELLDRAGLGFDQLDRVAVGVGPGTFTGLRIGLSTARALARASGRPLVGVSTLEALALVALDASSNLDTVAAVLDARRGEVFAAVWRAGESVPLIAPAAFAPGGLADALQKLGLTVLAVGEGAVEFRSTLEPSGAIVPDDDSELHRVSAAGHCRIAEHRAPSDPDQIRPEYLRLPDAEIALRARGNP